MKNRIAPSAGVAWALIASAAMMCFAGALRAQTVNGQIIWDKAGSPYRLSSDLVISAGSSLTLRPGVTFLMGRGVSLIVEGDLLALGQPDDPILFTSASDHPAPGDWGSIRFVTADTTLSYDESGAFIKGSQLSHCVIEYGGMPAQNTPREFLGGALHCRKSSPYLTHLTLRKNLSLLGGAIYCHEFASPYISDCLFLENEARGSGGGLACFFYSNAIIQRSVFQANKAGEHGGGIYFSFSSPQISDNIIENNQAAYYGGGLCGSNTVTGAVSVIKNNVLLSNFSGKKAHSIYLTAKIRTNFQNNCLFSDEGFDVFVDALESDLEFAGNYFGPLAEGDLEARLRDRHDDPVQKTVQCEPLLDTPPPDAPNAPQEVSSFELHGDKAFLTDWPYALCPRAPIYLEVRAQDRNPYHADWVPVRLRSSVGDPRGIVALAWETEPASGIFRLAGSVRNFSSAKEGAIRAALGEDLFFSVEGCEGFEISRKVEAAKCFITELRLTDEADSLHVVNHSPVFSWQLRNIFGSPQKAYRLQLSSGSSFALPFIWESGEISSLQTQAEVAGAKLEDGASYSFRLSVTHGTQWSDWADMTLRMNSLPAIPQLSSPTVDQVVNQARAALSLQSSSDAEGDPIAYEIQLSQDPACNTVLANEEDLRALSGTVSWTSPVSLADNAEYYWRARAKDPYEMGAWTSPVHFYANLVQEPPLPFGLRDPQPGQVLYHLQPVFSWEKTSDPDPLSSLRYRLLVSTDEKFLAANTVKGETDEISLKLDTPLKNDVSYCWRVDAIDNTGKITPSVQIGRFSVSTTPSQPQWQGPVAGEEQKPADLLVWSASVDPNPEDIVSYRLQIAEKDLAKPLFEETLSAHSVSISSLINYGKLSDDREYRVRVRAEDNQGVASQWSKETGWFFFNQINSAPGPVGLPMLPDGTVASQPEPVLTWKAAVDPDKSDPPSALSYLIQFDQEGVFAPGCRQVSVAAGITQISIPNLADNAKWFYRVCAQDDEGALSGWSPTKNFVHNLANDPPSPFSLTAPQDGITTYQLAGHEFIWAPAADIDPADKVHYLVHLAPAEGGVPILDGKRVDGTTFKNIAPLKNETDYLWWIEAVDLAGARTPSAKYHLKINTTPTIPAAESIAGGIMTGTEAIRWSPSTDPDPADVLSYNLQIISPDNPLKSLLDLSRIAPAKVTSGVGAADLKGLKLLKDNQTYAFRVRATDPHGALSGWSEPISFVLDLQNEPPTAPAIRQPSGGMLRDIQIAVSWSASTDPDPADAREGLGYRLQAVRGQQFTGATPTEHVTGGETALPNLELSDNQLWTIRLRSEDQRGGKSAWSAPVQFVINTVEDPPSAPEIRSPALGSVINAPNPIILAWAASKDPDYKAVVSYQAQYWPVDQPEKIVTQEGITGLSHRLTGLAPDQTYNWQVSALDDTGLKSTSAVGSFVYHKSEPPPAPNKGIR